MEEQPTIIRNPAGDRDFAAAIDSALSSGIADPGGLQARLREAYPNAVVRPRGLTGEKRSVWYVYRDGRWTSGG